jgi:hypothetical protein
MTRTRGHERRAKEKKPWRTDARPQPCPDRAARRLHGDRVAAEAAGPVKRCNDRAMIKHRRSEIGSVNHPRNHE